MTAGGSHGERAGRRTRALIDPEAFAHNVRLAARLAGPGRQVLAVVKADAYGPGAAALAGAAVAAGAAKLGVATLGEARTLRESGTDRPILVMAEIAPDAAAEAVSTPHLCQSPCSGNGSVKSTKNKKRKS